MYQMKLFKRIILFLCFLVAIYSCGSKSDNASLVTHIKLDINTTDNEIDISPYLGDDFEIITLETKEECLISDPMRIIYGNGWILIAEPTNQSVYLFDKNGQFVQTIGRKGRGPGEYTAICDVCVIDSIVYIADLNAPNIVSYNLDGTYVKTIKYDENICFEEIATVGNEICLITNHTNCMPRYYNLLYFDIDTKNITPALPFDDKKARSNSVWGLNRYASSYKDTTLLTLPTNDTIFAITRESANPRYVVKFSGHNLPEELKTKEADRIIAESMMGGYIKGVEQIINSKDILFLNYIDGDKSKDVIYEKLSGKYKIGNWMVINDLGGIYCTNYAATNVGEFIVFQDASMFLQAWEGRYSRRDFKDPQNKQRIQKIANDIDMDSNPVIFRFKFN